MNRAIAANSDKIVPMRITNPHSPIAKYRAERGWSQMKLAHEASVSLPTIQRAEKGSQNITYGTAVKIATALGVSPDDIYEGDDAPGAAFTNTEPEWARANHEQMMAAIERVRVDLVALRAAK